MLISTQEQLEAAEKTISAQFTDKVELKKTTYQDHPAIEITRAAMYAAPEYEGPGGLWGMLNLFTTACGGNQCNETGNIHRLGCDTCDWGSLYGNVYTVWEE